MKSGRLDRIWLRTAIFVYIFPINYQCTASISLPIQRALCAFHINQYLTKIVSVFAYQLLMHCFISFAVQWAICDVHINQYLAKIVSVFAYQLLMHCFDLSTFSVVPLC